MDLAELEALVDDAESDRVERKESLTSHKDRVCEAICAFANDLPNHRTSGVVFVGVTDNGKPSGLPITDQLLIELSSIRSDGNILPFPSMTVQKHRLHGTDVAVVEVHPCDNPPVRYEGRVWIRVGPRRAVATAEDERRLTEKRLAGARSFDARPVASATVDDLDVDLFIREYLPSAVAPDVLAENRRTTMEHLASLRFTTPDGVPTTAGLLVVGNEPLRFLPGAYIQFLRIEGGELFDPVKDERAIAGALASVLRLCEETLTVNLSTAVDFAERTAEERLPDYPMTALRQLLRNAVLHRNYETSNSPVRVIWFRDRVEIHSPGGPYGQVTVDNFGHPGLTDYRNPLLAESMRALGFVQQFGAGLPLARRAIEENGNPPLKFVVNESNVLATLRSNT